MSNCPYCQQQIEITENDYGALTYTCPHCSNIFGISFSGEVITPVELEPQENQISNPDINSFESIQPESQPNDFNFATTPQTIEESPFISHEMASEVKVETDVELTKQPTPVIASEPISAKEVFTDIVEFANSNVNFANITYTLEIRGIDTAVIRNGITESLTDSKLNLDVENLLASIKGGQLVLSKVNPLKAAIIYSRIRFLPVDVSWSQDE